MGEFRAKIREKACFYKIATSPVNDAFTNAIFVSGFTVSNYVSNVGTIKEDGEPKHAGVSGGASLWWRWTAPSPATMQVTLTGNLPSPVVAIYTGDSLTNLVSVNSGDGSIEYPVKFTAQAGIEYRIAVDSATGCFGDFMLQIAGLP